MAELILHHARASECRDVEGFKAEMATLVTQARKNTITLEKVSRAPRGRPLRAVLTLGQSKPQVDGTSVTGGRSPGGLSLKADEEQSVPLPTSSGCERAHCNPWLSRVAPGPGSPGWLLGQ